MYMTPLRENLLVAIFTAGLAGVGWLLTNQVNTNKSLWKALTDAVTEFRIAIQMITEKDNQQKTICQLHRERSQETSKALKSEIDRLENDIHEMRGAKQRDIIEERKRSRFDLEKDEK